MRALGMRVLVPLRLRPLAPRPRRSRRPPATTWSSFSARAARRRSTSCPLGVAPAAAAIRRSRSAELRAPLDSARGPRALASAAKRPHKNLAALLDALAPAPPRTTARCWCCPAIRRRHEEELRERARGARHRGPLRFLGWVTTAQFEGLYARVDAVRVPLAVRGLWPAGARGHGRGRPGRLLEPHLAARGRGRRRAALSTPRARARSLGRRRGRSSATTPCAHACGRRGRSTPRGSPGRRPRRQLAAQPPGRGRTTGSSLSLPHHVRQRRLTPGAPTTARRRARARWAAAPLASAVGSSTGSSPCNAAAAARRPAANRGQERDARRRAVDGHVAVDGHGWATTWSSRSTVAPGPSVRRAIR